MDTLVEFLFSISHWVNGGVFALLWIGVWLRRDRRKHVPIMLAAFVADMINVLVIELNREAVKKTLETATSGGQWMLKIHIAASIVAVVCYLVAIGSGAVLFKTRVLGRRLHKRNAAVFLVSRTINFVTSFWV